MKLRNCTARNVKISIDLDHWILYQRVMDKQSRDELVEVALIAYHRACVAEDDRTPLVPGLDYDAQPQSTTQPMQSPGQADPGTVG